MKCNSCGMEVPDDKKFCPKCGTSLSSSEVHKMGRVCDNCGENIPAGTKFCPNCGAVETEEKCPKCGVIVSKNDPFCQNCGFDLRKKAILVLLKITSQKVQQKLYLEYITSLGTERKI